MTEQLALGAANLSELQARHKALKDDFKYNLKLMDERDRELAQFDTVYADTRKLVPPSSACHRPSFYVMLIYTAASVLIATLSLSLLDHP